jgi:hypothetical protein
VKRLWAVTAYFNPCHYESKYNNYVLFANGLKAAGVPLLTVECASYGQPFELPAANVLRVRSGSIMWQKERMLNIGISSLPAACDCVAILDCDLLFLNEKWVEETIHLLHHFGIVQLFERAVRLSPGSVRPLPGDWANRGFIAQIRDAQMGNGHPGFAWALRREVATRCKLYDVCVTGGADTVMAHAWLDAVGSSDVHTVLPGTLYPHYLKWAARALAVVQRSVGYVPGEVHHLWHGETLKRRYLNRYRILSKNHFDPRYDLELNHYGCWEWASDKPALHNALASYFMSRQEDGDTKSYPIQAV